MITIENNFFLFQYTFNFFLFKPYWLQTGAMDD